MGCECEWNKSLLFVKGTFIRRPFRLKGDLNIGASFLNVPCCSYGVEISNSLKFWDAEDLNLKPAMISNFYFKSGTIKIFWNFYPKDKHTIFERKF